MSKYALLLNASPNDVGPAVNGLEYALDLDDAGHEVDVFFDGVATQWPGTLAEKPEHPVNEYFSDADERGLIAGACRFCANAFDAAAECETADVELLGGADEHAPDVGDLVAEGYELLTVG